MIEEDEHVLECACCGLKLIVEKKNKGENLDCMWCEPHNEKKCTHEGRYFFPKSTELTKEG